MTSIMSNQIMTEIIEVSFSSGGAVVQGKTDYNLIGAYAVNRPTTETNNYAITSIYGRTDGTYRLQNASATLSSRLHVCLIWLRK